MTKDTLDISTVDLKPLLEARSATVMCCSDRKAWNIRMLLLQAEVDVTELASHSCWQITGCTTPSRTRTLRNSSTGSESMRRRQSQQSTREQPGPPQIYLCSPSSALPRCGQAPSRGCGLVSRLLGPGLCEIAQWEAPGLARRPVDVHGDGAQTQSAKSCVLTGCTAAPHLWRSRFEQSFITSPLLRYLARERRGVIRASAGWHAHRSAHLRPQYAELWSVAFTRCSPYI